MLYCYRHLLSYLKVGAKPKQRISLFCLFTYGWVAFREAMDKNFHSTGIFFGGVVFFLVGGGLNGNKLIGKEWTLLIEGGIPKMAKLQISNSPLD